MAVHQADFLNNPKRSHDNDVKWIEKHLKVTADKGLIHKVDPKKFLEVYIDAEFVGGFNRANSK